MEAGEDWRLVATHSFSLEIEKGGASDMINDMDLCL